MKLLLMKIEDNMNSFIKTFIPKKSFLKKFFSVALPVIITSFITFFVGFVDNFMVGSVSNSAVSGVYAANQLTFFIDIAIFGVMEGAGIFIQQFMGAKDTNHLKQSFRFKLVLITIFIVIVYPIFYFFGKDMIYLFCHNDLENAEILSQGSTYFKLILISLIPYAYGFSYTSSLRETGNAKYAIRAGIAGLITNIVFNYLLIYTFSMGVVGAALATILARLVETIVLIVVSHKNKLVFCTGAFKDFKIDKSLQNAILKKGIPLFINEIFWAGGIISISLGYSQREGVLSALSIVNTMSNIFDIIFQALSIAIGVMVGAALGNNEFQKAKETNRKLYFMGIVSTVIGGILLILTSGFIPFLFKEVNASQKLLATTLMRIYGVFMWAHCLVTLFYMTLKTGGEALTTLIFDAVVMWSIYVPLCYIIILTTNLPLVFIYLIITGLDVLKFIFGLLLVRKGKWVRNITHLKEKLANG